MFNVLQAVQIVEGVAGLIPVAVKLIGAVEGSVGASAPAEAKMEMVKAGLTSFYSAFGSAEVAFEHVWPHIAAMLAAYQKDGGIAAAAALFAPEAIPAAV